MSSDVISASVSKNDTDKLAKDKQKLEEAASKLLPSDLNFTSNVHDDVSEYVKK